MAYLVKGLMVVHIITFSFCHHFAIMFINSVILQSNMCDEIAITFFTFSFCRQFHQFTFSLCKQSDGKVMELMNMMAK